MSKSLNARCIRRWEVEFKGCCDSKFSLCLRKHHLRGFICQTVLVTADCIVEQMAEDSARVYFSGVCRWMVPRVLRLV